MVKAFRTVFLFIFIYGFLNKDVDAQPFEPPPEISGSTAISHIDSRIKSWAKKVESLNRGYQDISHPELGFATAGTDEMVLGQAFENGVLSLGDGGAIVLKFDPSIRNDSGFDFAVFENGFSDDFLELAHVAVSNDGINFFTFPSESLTDTSVQLAGFGLLNTRNIHNLAGKYRAGFGTPFDLEDLKKEANLDLSQIRYVKITDVVGSINPTFGTVDSKGKLINDPFPTPYFSGGFDLDAVCVLNQQTASTEGDSFEVFPNLISSGELIHIRSNQNFDFQLTNMQGQNLSSMSVNQLNADLDMPFPNGIYFLKMRSGLYAKTVKICVR